MPRCRCQFALPLHVAPVECATSDVTMGCFRKWRGVPADPPDLSKEILGHDAQAEALTLVKELREPEKVKPALLWQHG